MRARSRLYVCGVHACMLAYTYTHLQGCLWWLRASAFKTCFQFKLTCYILPELTTPANALIPVGPSCVGGRNPSLLGHASFTVNCQQSGGHYTFVYVLWDQLRCIDVYIPYGMLHWSVILSRDQSVRLVFSLQTQHSSSQYLNWSFVATRLFVCPTA